MKIKALFTMLLFLGSICSPTFTKAQFEDPDPSPTSAPFDGGLTIIIAASVGYAIKRKHDATKKQGIQEETDKLL